MRKTPEQLAKDPWVPMPEIRRSMDKTFAQALRQIADRLDQGQRCAAAFYHVGMVYKTIQTILDDSCRMNDALEPLRGTDQWNAEGIERALRKAGIWGAPEEKPSNL